MNGATYPLSHPQQRIYLVQVMNPGTPVWNVPYGARGCGVLDLDAMRQAVCLVVNEFDGLRLRFTEVEGEIRQYVADPEDVPLETVALDAGGDAAYDAWSRRWVTEPVWALDAPLFRFACARITDNTWGVVVKGHHIIMDGRGALNTVSRLLEIYEVLREGGAVPARVERASYLAYLGFEEGYVSSAQAAEDRAFWLKQFESIPEKLELYPHAATGSVKSNRKSVLAPPDLSARIYAFCEERKTSPYRLVLAALYVYLARTSRNPDVVIGTAFLNRDYPGMADIVGMFVSTIPIRLRTGLEADFPTLLDAIKALMAEIRGHERYPFDILANDIRERDGQAAELIQVTIAQVVRSPLPGGARLEYLCRRSHMDPLTVYVSHARQGESDVPVELFLDYQTDIFTEERIESLAGSLLNILDDALGHAERPLSHLNMLSEAERRMVLMQFNATEHAFPTGKTLHRLFEEQVARTPDNTALVFRDTSMTYAELDERANRLARLLREKGSRPDTIVGLLVDRSPAMIIGALGILKSGAGYAPIDPNYPDDRIAYMLENSQATLLVTQGQYVGKMAFSQQVVNLDDVDDLPADKGTLQPDSGPEHVACLIYTSGSTGNPKGVILEHKALVNFTFCMIRDRGLTPEDRVAKFASFSFDVSIFEIYPALSAGAALYIVPDEIRLNLVPLNDYYEQNGITRAFFTTQLGEQFMELFDNRSLVSMEVGGEKLRSFRKRQYRFINCYGPTETSVYCTQFPVERDYTNIPIGKPLANYRIYIVDQYNNPQPVGAPGELCIAGIGLARGYWNLPDKTAAAFVDNPFEPGERMYRSGDLARWLADGNLEHLGRIDRQLKIRGFRIEPGEIETAILKLSDVSQCAVVDIREPNGRVSLCAYVVSGREMNSAVLRRELGTTLPEYMLPQYVIRMDRFPLTGSGKIDRRALPRPEAEAIEETEYAAPRTETEERLAELWADVLKLPRVGIDDNFFSIGGHSLKASFLIARMERQVGVRVSMRDFFGIPTIRQLSERAGQHAEELPRIEPAAVTGGCPLTPPQAQLFVLSRMGGIDVTYNVPQRLTFREAPDPGRLSRALQALLERHGALRSAFSVREGEPVQTPCGEIRLERRFQAIDDSEVEAVSRAFVRPFDLARPPLMRALLLESTGGVTHLLLDFHHIACDGVSVGILLRELDALYCGEKLPEPRLQFSDYAAWYARFRQEGHLTPLAGFWEEMLTDPQPAELPLDHPRGGAAVAFRGATRSFLMERESARAVASLASRCGATLHIVLLSVLHLLVARYTRQADVITGTSLAGRTMDEISDMVGMFVVTLPVRSCPEAGLTVREYVARVKETMMGVHQNQLYPMEQVYEKLGLRRGAGRHPLFDINFVLRNMELAHEGGALSYERHPIPTATSKFDITLAADEVNATLRFKLDYRADLFDADTIERLAGHFLHLAAEMAADPQRCLGAITMVTPDELSRLLAFNPRPVALPAWPTVVDAFRGHAARQPDRTALVAGDGSLTYGELERQALSLALLLREKGVGPDQVVAIMADRSRNVVVGMLATVMAGGAYTAVDPAYPAERIAHILENAAPRVILGNRAVLDGVRCAGERIALDQPFAASQTLASGIGSPSPGDLAYIIYTSGSTGVPKGVMVEHRSLANFLGWYTALHGFSPADNAAAFASFSFDACVAQVWAPLVSGASLHIIPEELRLSPADLSAYFEANAITHAHFPTQFAEQFMAMTDNRSLKRLVVGGDALRSYRPQQYRLVNEYGPSEATVACSAIAVDRPYDKVPIGTPADNARIYILDANLRPQPLGVPGEICIAGAGLARGYRNNPQQTAERFVADPFVAGERMYRTGDLGRWLADGTLDFLGRVDFQVKIRGFRIELAEIEQALSRVSGVGRCVVLARDDGAGGKYLCAYYEAEAEMPAQELKAGLAATLPEYMIPAAFVRLDALPVTRNGKIDRQALPDPDFTAPAGEIVAPRNRAEELVAAAWRAVLKGWEGSVFNNFFEAGGDSLRAIALVARLQTHFAVRIGDIFAWPTLAEQAARLAPAADNLKLRIGRLKDSLAATLAARARLADNPGFQEQVAAYRGSYKELLRRDFRTRRPLSTILLTGATGYLGAYLLRELLHKREECLLVLPVRGRDQQDAEARLHAKLAFYFGPHYVPQHRNRFRVVCADLTKERLGLPEDRYAELAQSVECIVHSAANVRHYGAYEEFRLSNVIATEHLLRLAKEGKRAPSFHYISTTSTGMGVAEGAYVIFSEDVVDIGQKPENVYVRTKLEAEMAVAALRGNGVDARIYRVGNIAFDSETGAFQENMEENGFFQQIRAYAELGYAPAQGDERNITFVDQCSRAFVALFDIVSLANETFHLTNPHTVKLSAFLCKPGLGLAIEQLPLPDFLDRLLALMDLEPFREVAEKLMLHQGWLDRDPDRVLPPLVTLSDKSERCLAEAGFEWPAPEPATMRRLMLAALAKRQERLRAMALFSLLNSDEIDLLVLGARPLWAADEERIAHEGEEPRAIYLLADGHLEVSRTALNGWTGTVRVMSSGELVGKDLLLHQLPSPANVEPVLGGAYLLAYRPETLRRLLDQSPRFALGLTKQLSFAVNRLESLFVDLE